MGFLVLLETEIGIRLDRADSFEDSLNPNHIELVNSTFMNAKFRPMDYMPIIYLSHCKMATISSPAALTTLLASCDF